MPARNYQDVVVGILIALCGFAVAAYSSSAFNAGTLQRMGPGMFPLAMGGLLVFLGLLLSLVSLLRTQVVKPIEVQWRPAALVLIAVTLFAVSVKTLGLLPAVLAVVLVSSFAENKARIAQVAILGTVLCALAYLIFQVGLGMNFVLIRWDF